MRPAKLLHKAQIAKYPREGGFELEFGQIAELSLYRICAIIFGLKAWKISCNGVEFHNCVFKVY